MSLGFAPYCILAHTRFMLHEAYILISILQITDKFAIFFKFLDLNYLVFSILSADFAFSFVAHP